MNYKIPDKPIPAKIIDTAWYPPIHLKTKELRRDGPFPYSEQTADQTTIFYGKGVTKYDLECAAKLLTNPESTITEFIINASNVDDDHLKPVLDAFKKINKLERLILRHCNLTQQFIVELMDAVKNYPKLYYLDLSGTKIGDSGAAVVGRAIREGSMPANDVRLANCSIGNFGAKRIMENCKKFTELNLANNIEIKDAGILKISKILTEVNPKNLTKLNLARTGISFTNTVRTLCEAIRNLPVIDIDISSNTVSIEGSNYLQRYITETKKNISYLSWEEKTLEYERNVKESEENEVKRKIHISEVSNQKEKYERGKYIITILGASSKIGTELALMLSETRPDIMVRYPTRSPFAEEALESKQNIRIISLKNPPDYGMAAMGSHQLVKVLAFDEVSSKLAKQTIHAAIRAGIPHVIFLSTFAAEYPETTAGRWFSEAEKVITSQTDVSYTIIRTSIWMECFTFWVEGQNGILLPSKGVRYSEINLLEPLPGISWKDVCKLVDAILRDPSSHFGKTYRVKSPTPILASVGLEVCKEENYPDFGLEVLSSVAELKQVLPVRMPVTVITPFLDLLGLKGLCEDYQTVKDIVPDIEPLSFREYVKTTIQELRAKKI